jgi:hypothetical protein
MSSLTTPILGYVVVDKTGNALLYDPTIIQYTESLSIDIPFMYDAGSFTVFRDKPTIEVIKQSYQYEFDNLGYRVITLTGVNEDCFAEGLQ